MQVTLPLGVVVAVAKKSILSTWKSITPPTLCSLAHQNVVGYSIGKTAAEQTKRMEPIWANLGTLPGPAQGVMPDSAFHMVFD